MFERRKKDKCSTLLEAINQCKEMIGYQFVINDFSKVIDESREGAERVKKIISDLKDFSRIDVESAAGKGTTFTILLPVRDDRLVKGREK